MKPTTTAFRQIACELNRELREKGRKKRINPLELVALTKRFSGRCAYCSVPCIPKAGQRSTQLNFQWYIPLDRGGETTIDNLVPVCSEHLHRYRPTKRQRETIPDINTFGDLVYNLIKSVITTSRLKSDNNVDAFRWEEKTNRIKREINGLLEEIIISSQYHPFTDWMVKEPVFHEEDINTIPDIIEGMTEKEIVNDTVDGRVLDEPVKQILSTKQYKIIRKEKNG